MTKTSKHDIFEMQHCIAGLAQWLQYANTHLYEYCYYLTFKREFKSYISTYNDAFDEPIDMQFFADSNDPFVQQAFKVKELISNFLANLLLRHGLTEEFDIDDYDVTREAKRYAPTQILSFKRKSYSYLKINYAMYLEGMSTTLYYYCAALTMKSYVIPAKMRSSLAFSPTGSFKYLDIDNYDVCALTELILELERM